MNVKKVGDPRIRNFLLSLGKLGQLRVKLKPRRLVRPFGRILDRLLGDKTQVTPSRLWM